MTAATTPAKPRKSPVQARSVATVEAIHTATIQVLVAEGLARCTTTRVAERAGVSVGSLYQYYPNRSALLAAVLRCHLDQVTEAVEQACLAQRSQPIAEMAQGLVNAFIGAKLKDPAASKALYAVADGHGGTALVNHAKARIHKAVALMLSTAPGVRFEELQTVSLLATSAMIGPAQALLEEDVSPAFTQALRLHLCTLVQAYLQSVAQPV